jgi:hypothetical protein
MVWLTKSKRCFWAVDIKEKQPCFVFYLTVMWNFLYTTWNMAFVYGENPSYFASSFCVAFFTVFFDKLFYFCFRWDYMKCYCKIHDSLN